MIDFRRLFNDRKKQCNKVKFNTETSTQDISEKIAINRIKIQFNEASRRRWGTNIWLYTRQVVGSILKRRNLILISFFRSSVEVKRGAEFRHVTR